MNNRNGLSLSPQQLVIYDTTLRDGTQREGLSLSIEDKIRIAERLDRLGVHFIEGGWAGANPKDGEFFRKMQEHRLHNAELVVFCSTRKAGISADQDPMLVPILAAQTRWVTIFGKSWDLHVTEGLRTTLDENLAMIADTIAYLNSHDRHVIYDAEHWFDGYKNNPDYALQTLKTAFESGAAWFVLCDTNGGTLPEDIAAITAIVAQSLRQWSGQSSQHHIGIHTHNDTGLAVANALSAVRHGATMIQGTINGYGERCGNANLCTLIPNLQLKMGYQCITPEQLCQLTEVSRQVSEIVNLAPDDHAAFVGASAFAHKGGIHVSAVQRNPLTYEHINPEQVGNLRRIVISEQAGISNVISKVETFGICLRKEDPACRQILQKTKQLEQMGYQFESAEASFELLVREALGDRPQFFTISNFHVYCSSDTHRHDGIINSQATVKVVVNGQEQLTAAEGNGPVAALDLALRKALINFYPEIASFYLTDYKVRILNSEAGTHATTRVLIEFSNSKRRWTTAGVSDNIIDASCKALGEGFEYGLLSAVRHSWT